MYIRHPGRRRVARSRRGSGNLSVSVWFQRPPRGFWPTLAKLLLGDSFKETEMLKCSEIILAENLRRKNLQVQNQSGWGDCDNQCYQANNGSLVLSYFEDSASAQGLWWSCDLQEGPEQLICLLDHLPHSGSAQHVSQWLYCRKPSSGPCNRLITWALHSCPAFLSNLVSQPSCTSFSPALLKYMQEPEKREGSNVCAEMSELWNIRSDKSKLQNCVCNILPPVWKKVGEKEGTCMYTCMCTHL